MLKPALPLAAVAVIIGLSGCTTCLPTWDIAFESQDWLEAAEASDAFTWSHPASVLIDLPDAAGQGGVESVRFERDGWRGHLSIVGGSWVLHKGGQDIEAARVETQRMLQGVLADESLADVVATLRSTAEPCPAAECPESGSWAAEVSGGYQVPWSSLRADNQDPGDIGHSHWIAGDGARLRVKVSTFSGQATEDDGAYRDVRVIGDAYGRVRISASDEDGLSYDTAVQRTRDAFPGMPAIPAGADSHYAAC